MTLKNAYEKLKGELPPNVRFHLGVIICSDQPRPKVDYQLSVFKEESIIFFRYGIQSVSVMVNEAIKNGDQDETAKSPDLASLTIPGEQSNGK